MSSPTVVFLAIAILFSARLARPQEVCLSNSTWTISCNTGTFCCEDGGCCPHEHDCCGSFCCEPGNECCDGECHVDHCNSTVCNITAEGSVIYCSKGQICCDHDKCCGNGTTCCGNYCCGSGEICCNNVCVSETCSGSSVAVSLLTFLAVVVFGMVVTKDSI